MLMEKIQLIQRTVGASKFRQVVDDIDALEEGARDLGDRMVTEQLQLLKFRALVGLNDDRATELMNELAETAKYEPPIVAAMGTIISTADPSANFPDGLLSGSIKLLSRVAEQHATDSVLLETLARLYHRAGERETAIELARRAVDNGGDAADYHQQFLGDAKVPIAIGHSCRNCSSPEQNNPGRQDGNRRRR